jgi:hypothetical protein
VKYQLALQWPAASIKDYDAIIGMEDLLMESLPEAHVVDGHDAGSGEMNIFIHTNAPRKAFAEVKLILGTRDLWGTVRAGYRRSDGSEYTVLWPPNATEFSIS